MQSACNTSSVPAAPLSQPPSSEFLWHLSLPGSQLTTNCPKRRKCQYCQVLDYSSCLRHRAQFPVQKMSHSWESKIHTTFCRNLMGNYVWGNFHNLRYANSLFDCNANPWSVLLPCLLWEAINTGTYIKNESTKVKLVFSKCLFF